MFPAAAIFILFAVSAGNSPDLTALAVYSSQEACQTAAKAVSQALETGEDGKHVMCISAESLEAMGKANAGAE
jgi:hypothetical protein